MIDLTMIDQEELKSFKTEIFDFQNQELTILAHKLGLILWQIENYNEYNPNIILKRDFTVYSKNLLDKTRQILKEKYCNKNVEEWEKVITITILIELINDKFGFNIGISAIIGIFILRGINGKFKLWICSDKTNYDSFGYF
jgi:hypothetical protein